MNFDDLRTSWADTNAERASAAERERLVVRVCRKTEQFRGRILRRDLLETLACVFVAWGFGREVIEPAISFFERLGAVVLVAAAVFIAIRINAARLYTPAAGIDAPVRDFCGREIDRLDGQIRLLRSVLCWYLGPLMLGVTLRSFGRHAWNPEFFVESAVFAAASLLLWWLNRSVAGGKLTDLRNELAQLAAELATDPTGPNKPLTNPEEP